MDVLSSQILLRPSDLDRSRRFYRDVLGLAIYREFGPRRRTVGPFQSATANRECRGNQADQEGDADPRPLTPVFLLLTLAP